MTNFLQSFVWDSPLMRGAASIFAQYYDVADRDLHGYVESTSVAWSNPGLDHKIVSGSVRATAGGLVNDSYLALTEEIDNWQFDIACTSTAIKYAGLMLRAVDSDHHVRIEFQRQTFNAGILRIVVRNGSGANIEQRSIVLTGITSTSAFNTIVVIDKGATIKTYFESQPENSVETVLGLPAKVNQIGYHFDTANVVARIDSLIKK
jgi:hypothetical protein